MKDENIREARLKIAVDLCVAVKDPVLIDRMEKYESHKFSSDVVDIPWNLLVFKFFNNISLVSDYLEFMNAYFSFLDS